MQPLTDTLSLVPQYHAPLQPFCNGAMAELPAVPDPAAWRAAAEELSYRRDLRGPEYYVCSIDPVGCTDVDDAMHVRFLGASEVAAPDTRGASGSGGGGGGGGGTAGGGGRGRGGVPRGGVRELVEVGVHIADVSYFVRPGGMLDGEARDRCTSVYLVDR